MQLNPIEEMIAQVPVWIRLLMAMVPALGLMWGIWGDRKDFR